MTYEVTLSIGSNRSPEPSVIEALRRLDVLVELKSISRVYRTRPIGMEPGASDFHNLCVLMGTERQPGSLKELLRSVEEAMGRERSRGHGEPYESRRIDIDILTIRPSPEGWTNSDDIEGNAYVVYPLSDLIVPPDSVTAEDVDDWRNHCDSDIILGIEDYNWPDSLYERVVS